MRTLGTVLESSDIVFFSCRKFFFFKQKTAYEISLGLVGSEMCIRDRCVKFFNELKIEIFQ